MIEKFLVSELDTIAELNHQLYPVAAPVGELEGSFCIYTRVSGEVQRDLMGEPVYCRDVYRLDLYDDDTDTLFANPPFLSLPAVSFLEGEQEIDLFRWGLCTQ